MVEKQEKQVCVKCGKDAEFKVIIGKIPILACHRCTDDIEGKLPLILRRGFKKKPLEGM